MPRGARVLLAFGALAAIGMLARSARADERPPGPWMTFEARPATTAARACSTIRNVCVRGAPSAAVLATLEAFERAWDAVTFALRLPQPDVDPETLAYEVHLVPGLADVEADSFETVPFARDVRSRVDRTLAFTRVDDRVRRGCALDALAVRALVTASLLGATPAAPQGVVRAHAAAFAMLAVPCSAALASPEVEAFQAGADRSIVDARVADPAAAAEDPPFVRASRAASARHASGAAIWWSRLDWAYGRQPGDVLRATWALAPTTTPIGAARWNDEPDAFDVLRKTFQGALSTGSTFADLVLDASVARAFVGTPGVLDVQPELAIFDARARVPVWDVPWPSEPRRLAPRAPVAPTGATYVAVDTRGAPPSARLRVEIAWEEHALFRWALVKIGVDGREIGRVPISTQDRAHDAQMSLVDLDPSKVARVLLVGTNAGDPAYAFDPDEEAWEPHAALVTIAAE